MNLASIIDAHPDHAVALVSDGVRTTYGELRSRVAAARGALVAEGVRPGDRVAVVSENDPDFVVACLATLGVGGVLVPLNPQSPRAEIDPQLTDVGATLVLVGAAGQRLQIAASRSVADLAGEPAPVVDRAPGDLAVLAFTSGTAGAPKAAMLTHGNLLANIEQVAQVADLRRRPDDVTLDLLPLFHVFGLNVVLLPALEAGGTVVLIRGFDPVAAIGAIAEHGVTTLTGPPTVWRVFLDLPAEAAPADSFASVRIAASGASALPIEVGEGIRDRFGNRIHEGYGLTETSPVVATTAGTDAPIGSIGRPLPGVEVRLVDAEGDDVLVGDVGEIHVRGANVFAGYWDAPDATAAVLTPDGWLRTGDLATVDDDGNLFVVDRMKDLVIVSGFNVYPAEVEGALLAHPAVAEAAVVGEPHPRTGEAVVAHVVLRAGVPAPSPDELVAAVAERLARYKCPHEVRIVDEIPRGMGGKIMRHRLDDGAGRGTL